MSQLDELKKRYQELGEEIAKLEKQPKVPPKGWPVFVGLDRSVKISGGDVDSNNWILAYDDMKRNGTIKYGYYQIWKPYTLPDGRELSPENFGKGGHKVEIKKIDHSTHYIIRMGDRWGYIDYSCAMALSGKKFDTIGNEWVEV